MGFIYKITCIPTQKVYIGKTETTINKRWLAHCSSAYLSSHKDYNQPFHRAIRKYGKDNFLIEELQQENDSEKLKELEKYWINYYDSYNKGYNATLGGDGQLKYNYDDIVNYYLSHSFSLIDTCQHFDIYDQVVYSALQSKNINYKNLKSKKNRKKYNSKILLVEKNIIFNSMKEIDDYFGKQVHGNIRRCLNGVTKKAYGYTWKEVY